MPSVVTKTESFCERVQGLLFDLFYRRLRLLRRRIYRGADDGDGSMTCKVNSMTVRLER